MNSPMWTAVCRLEELTPGRGVAALVEGTQIALFRYDGVQVFAVGNRDPFSGAYVLSRGLAGSHGDVATVASPMYKQRFDLRTGRCLDDPAVALPVYPVRIREGLVEVLPTEGTHDR